MVIKMFRSIIFIWSVFVGNNPLTKTWVGHNGEQERAHSPWSREQWESDVTFLTGQQPLSRIPNPTERQESVSASSSTFNVGRVGAPFYSSFMHRYARLIFTTTRCLPTGLAATLFSYTKASLLCVRVSGDSQQGKLARLVISYRVTLGCFLSKW